MSDKNLDTSTGTGTNADIAAVSALLSAMSGADTAEREALVKKLEQLRDSGSLLFAHDRENIEKLISSSIEMEKALSARESRIEELESGILQRDEDIDHINSRVHQTRSRLNQQGASILKKQRSTNFKWALLAGGAVAVLMLSIGVFDHKKSQDELVFWQNKNLDMQKQILADNSKIDELARAIDDEKLRNLGIQTSNAKERARLASDYDSKISATEKRVTDAEERLKQLQASLASKPEQSVSANLYGGDAPSSASYRSMSSNETASPLYLKGPGGWLGFRWGMNQDQVKALFNSPQWRDGSKNALNAQACSVFPDTKNILATQGRGFGKDEKGQDLNLEISFCFNSNGFLSGVSTTMKDTAEANAKKIISGENGQSDNYQTTQIEGRNVEVWAWYKGPNQIELVKGLDNQNIIVGIGALKPPAVAWKD